MSTKKIMTRRRIVLAMFVFAMLALTSALAIAQDHGTTGHAPTEHGPATGAPIDPAHGDHATPAAAGAHGEAAEHGHGEVGGHHGPEPINWTDIWDKRRPAVLALLINFGVLLTLYYMLGNKPVAAALKLRRVTIGKDIDEAQKLLDEAKERAKKYQGDLKNADVDAATARAALIAAGKGEVERLLMEAQDKAARMKRDAERLVEQERKQLHHDLLIETVELAVAEASQILERAAQADDHARLAQDLLAELTVRPAARAADRAGSVQPSVQPPTGGVS